MDRQNILNKRGMLSDEDVKQPLVRGLSHFTFETCLDLSKPIKVIPYGTSTTFPLSHLTEDISSFIAWWTHFVRKDLNGFVGFHSVKYDTTGLTFIDKNNEHEITNELASNWWSTVPTSSKQTLFMGYCKAHKKDISELTFLDIIEIYKRKKELGYQ